MSLFEVATLLDPYPAYKELRDSEPVHFEPSMNVHVVLRYDLVREAIRDTETFSSRYDQFLGASQIMMFQQASPEIQQKMLEVTSKMIETPPTMLTLDEPDHTRYRSLVNKLFTASQVRGSQPTVEAVINSNAASMFAHDEADFMSAFALPVPIQIIGDRLGIPEDEREFFNYAATEAAAGLRLTPLSGEQMVSRVQTAVDLQQFLVGIVEARRLEPKQDMISILANAKLEDEDRLLTHGECLSVLNQFLVAGHETTSSAFGWGMLLLCKNPEVQDELKGDEKRIKTFVEEILRLEAPVQGLPRLVTKDTELGGYPLKAGDMVMLRYGAANRDERQFEAPDKLDIHRAKAGAQLAFGAGVHFCIGAPLARQELNLGFKKLLDCARDYRLDERAPPPQAEASFILRNMPTLAIKYEKI